MKILETEDIARRSRTPVNRLIINVGLCGVPRWFRCEGTETIALRVGQPLEFVKIFAGQC